MEQGGKITAPDNAPPRYRAELNAVDEELRADWEKQIDIALAKFLN